METVWRARPCATVEDATAGGSPARRPSPEWTHSGHLPRTSTATIRGPTVGTPPPSARGGGAWGGGRRGGQSAGRAPEADAIVRRAATARSHAGRRCCRR
eukprot:scaffold3020_cov342-Prasinococcus_capsulatus_cf.AAC.5